MIGEVPGLETPPRKYEPASPLFQARPLGFYFAFRRFRDKPST